MDFCTNCGTRLTLVRKKEEREKGALLLSCLRCGNEKRLARPVAFPKVIELSQERIAVIGKEEQKLRTLPTIRIGCPRCGNNLAYAWMVQIGKLEESSTQFFRCTKCNYTFREKS